MPLLVNQKIVRLQVTVDDASAVQMLHAKDDLSKIFLDPILWQTAENLDQ
jgi:hypothetical protein